MNRRAAVAWSGLVLVSCAACGARSAAPVVVAPTVPAPVRELLSAEPTTPAPVPTAAPVPTVAPAVPPPPVPSAAPKPPTSRAPATRAPAPKPAAPAGPAACAVPAGVTAPQVVLVKASGSAASIRACTRAGAGYVTSLGPYAGHVGLHGVSAAKREGDLRTPTGVYALEGGFGTAANPGLRSSWFVVDGADVWVDDPASALYNTHQRDPAAGRWTSAEPLQVGAYRYAQVIGYNDARTPGRGSAIFLHVDQGRGTAGCVSLPVAGLLEVLRWERPGAVIAIG